MEDRKASILNTISVIYFSTIKNILTLNYFNEALKESLDTLKSQEDDGEKYYSLLFTPLSKAVKEGYYIISTNIISTNKSWE